MANGAIKWFNAEKGYGFIKADDKELFFHINEVIGLGDTDLTPGRAVEFDEAQGKKGIEARQVRAVGAPIPTSPNLPRSQPSAPSAQNSPRRNEFLNPYNFVRYFGFPNVSDHEDKPDDPPEVKLLGHCAPPPHDRWVGLSGRITCNLKAVTPIFVSDSEEVSGGEHKTYRFFKFNGAPAIPASSLRGMVRAVFEAVTNSCYSVFDEESRLPYRDVGLAPKLHPGIVRQLPSGKQPGRIALCEEARVGAYSGGKRTVILDSMWKMDDPAFAIITTSRSHDRYAVEIARTREELGSDGDIKQGRLKITGEGNIDRKYCERFFYNEESDQSRWVAFSPEREKDYNIILAQQYEIEDFKTRHQHRRLTLGDMVYVELNDDRKSVRNIAAVRVPRLLYRASIGSLLPQKTSVLHHCTDPETLCPACRTFGWVRGERDEEGAYASRVRFSHARLVTPKPMNSMTLAILGEPKPTTTRFYLVPADGKPSQGRNDASAGYDGNNRLRGRKFYRHHPLNERSTTPPQRDQNRTIDDPQDKDAEFQFTVNFENLAPVELGALLWSLEIGGKGYHRLGYGKPLGLGSAVVSITNSREDAPRILDVKTRYADLSKDGYVPLANWSSYVEEFKAAAQNRWGKEFDQLAPVQDLLALLGRKEPSLPVYYPYSREEGSQGAFEWFVGNKRKEGPKLELDLATDDKGLPFIDKKGRLQ